MQSYQASLLTATAPSPHRTLPRAATAASRLPHYERHGIMAENKSIEKSVSGGGACVWRESIEAKRRSGIKHRAENNHRRKYVKISGVSRRQRRRTGMKESGWSMYLLSA